MVLGPHFAKRLRRNKRRLRDHHRDRETIAASANAPEYILAPQTEDDADTQPNDDNPAIIAENQTVIENLTVSEAVMRLDLADAPAFVFRNSKHGGLGVVYRRDDGNIGWIDTPADAS